MINIFFYTNLMSKYSTGFDPGYRNLGFTFVDIQTHMASIRILDLAQWGGAKHPVTECNLYALLRAAISEHDDLLKSLGM